MALVLNKMTLGRKLAIETKKCTYRLQKRKEHARINGLYPLEAYLKKRLLLQTDDIPPRILQYFVQLTNPNQFSQISEPQTKLIPCSGRSKN